MKNCHLENSKTAYASVTNSLVDYKLGNNAWHEIAEHLRGHGRAN